MRSHLPEIPNIAALSHTVHHPLVLWGYRRSLSQVDREHLEKILPQLVGNLVRIRFNITSSTLLLCHCFHFAFKNMFLLRYSRGLFDARECSFHSRVALPSFTAAGLLRSWLRFTNTSIDMSRSMRYDRTTARRAPSFNYDHPVTCELVTEYDAQPARTLWDYAL